MQPPKHLIIIPGIGDDHLAYHLGAKLFGPYGFRPHVRSFGWTSADADSYDTRLEEFLDYIDTLEGSVYLLGVSAGGTTAVNLLAARPQKIAAVATLCSPYMPFTYPVNPLLEVALSRMTANLSALSIPSKQKITSFHALFDQVVAVHLSQPVGITHRTLPSIMHAPTIFLGLTIWHVPLVRFFKQR